MHHLTISFLKLFLVSIARMHLSFLKFGESFDMIGGGDEVYRFNLKQTLERVRRAIHPVFKSPSPNY
jgi:hypothetical protein